MTSHDAARSDIRRLRAQLTERTADLQRVKAEYDNYRKRVHRDQLAVREIAVANVLARLLPVMDVIEQAREQGEVSGAFAVVAEELETQLGALGLELIGEAGTPFDPQVHDALSYASSEEVSRAICTEVLRSGYRVGDHMLRPAEVAVAGPPALDRPRSRQHAG
jgi:molecular chaperone GrpE